MRIVLSKRLFEISFKERGYSLRLRSLRSFVDKPLEGEANHDLKELVADHLSLRVVALFLSEWELLGSCCVRGDECEIDVAQLDVLVIN